MRQATNRKLPPLWFGLLDAAAAGHPVRPERDLGQIVAYRCLGATFGPFTILTLIRWRFLHYTDAPRGEVGVTPLGLRALDRERRRHVKPQLPKPRAPRGDRRPIPPPLAPGARPDASPAAYLASPARTEAAYAHAILSARYHAAPPETALDGLPSALEDYSSRMASLGRIMADYDRMPAPDIAWLRRALDVLTGH